MIDRRHLLGGMVSGATLLALSGRAAGQVIDGAARFAPPAPIIPIDARVARMFRVSVCLRPFRAIGPRIEAERVAGKRIVHHYGHGGSGWSLGWGSAAEAVPLALTGGVREVAVLGAGAIGLTTAITAQRMGARVTIYARERFPQVASANATGTFTPSSRLALDGQVAEGFADQWERMARASYAMNNSYLGLADAPVEWTDRYFLSDFAPGERPPSPVAPVAAAAPADGGDAPPPRRMVNFDGRIRDLYSRSDVMARADNPFAPPHARHGMGMTFNIAALARRLEAEFVANGGRFVVATLASVRDLRHVAEPLVINCTGMGAGTLFGDETLTPIRGQISWLLPQDGVRYGVFHNGTAVIARRDAIAVQAHSGADFLGFGESDLAPDMEAARAAVDLAARMFTPG